MMSETEPNQCEGRLRFREATIDSFDDYYYLRCDETNLIWTGYDTYPNYDDLFQWYKKQINNHSRKIVLAYDNDSIVGYLYLDLIDTKHVEISYGVHNEASGKGIGKKLVKFAFENAKKYYSDCDEIIAYIAERNIGSIKCVEYNGLVKTDSIEKRLLKSFKKEIVFRMYKKKITI